MSDDDRNYFRRRAEAELALARDAASPEAARAHSTLAGCYLNRLHGGDSEIAQEAASQAVMAA